jgi:hypothetical protein
LRRALKPDAQAFDEVRITTVPRFKDSAISGSEWRISAHVQFLRKGKVAYETRFADIKTACTLLAWARENAIDEGKAYNGGEGDFCDQEGCSEKATVFYKIRKSYCNMPYLHPPSDDGESWRAFCEKHSIRGNQSFDDSDSNYERLSEKPITNRSRELASNTMERQVKTTEKLAQALREARAPAEMIQKAEAGQYDDYKSDSGTPISDLVRDCERAGLMDLAKRAMNGEFDGTDEEAEEWFQREGKDLISGRRA